MRGPLKRIARLILLDLVHFSSWPVCCRSKVTSKPLSRASRSCIAAVSPAGGDFCRKAQCGAGTRNKPRMQTQRSRIFGKESLYFSESTWVAHEHAVCSNRFAVARTPLIPRPIAKESAMCKTRRTGRVLKHGHQGCFLTCTMGILRGEDDHNLFRREYK
jgi:hypothetical protein